MEINGDDPPPGLVAMNLKVRRRSAHNLLLIDLPGAGKSMRAWR
jgi:hypothetical protein